ncbi:MAG: hypothetical protein HY007_04075 [Candidatus Sungbacteria bacterium]|nr:hypothetical protein [Candidatus Sungbacteria bacterium]
MKELMEYLQNRPQTWAEKLQELKDENRRGLHATGRFPLLGGLLNAQKESIFWEAKMIVGAPLIISEERYPDRPHHVFYYWTEEYQHMSEFWHVYWHLDGSPWHECNEWCATHQLPEFVAHGW